MCFHDSARCVCAAMFLPCHSYLGPGHDVDFHDGVHL